MNTIKEYLEDLAAVFFWLNFLLLGTLMVFSVCSVQTLQKELHLSDKMASTRLLDLEERLNARQTMMERRLLQHSVPIQLGSLSPEDVAKLNIQLATAIAANQGCYVSIDCEPMTEGK